MKKLLLSFCGIAISASAMSQTCSPLQSWADTTDYGAYPDTIVNFPQAEQNVFYSTDLNFKVPAAVTADLDPTGGSLVGSEIESFVVDAVNGIPPGLDYACNESMCEYLGGANGCANIYGTPTTIGTYDITIDITATVILEVLGIPIPSPQSATFEGYKINVVAQGTAGLSYEVIEPLSIYPNPAHDKLTIANVASALNPSVITITDISGKVVSSLNTSSQSEYTFDVNGLENGLYIINVFYENGVESIKFMKD
jgi:hypothetical protein